jgi:protein-disulfide isomerase
MKPSLIVAILVGGAVGFGIGKFYNSAPSTRPGAVAVAPSPGGAPARPSPADDTTVYKVPLENAPVTGNAGALVTMIEFSDYQCPFCSRGHNTVKELQQIYGDKLRVAMKQNPLSFHPRAKPAALAAMAAGEQGKYWEMHDKMFSNQAALEDANLESYAKSIGLDMNKWKSDLANPKFEATIQADQALAERLGASGTPAFFINGRKISGALPTEVFRRVIDAELERAKTLVNAGTPAAQVYAKAIENGITAPPAQPKQAAAAPPAPAGPRKVDVPADSPVKGPKTAKVTMVLWSDFQCPFCSRIVPTMKQVEDAYAKDVRMVFRHQPLPMHPNAKIAAEASMAAHEQGKFWPFHDKMFANQQNLDRASLEKYAQELGLNMGKFKAALDSGKYTKRVEEDSAEGMAVGANGTPTFFLNGREFVGALPFESMKTAIDAEIKRADELLAKGIKPENLYAEMQKGLTAAPPAPEAPAAKVFTDIDIKNAPFRGASNAPVTLIAFSDFQCPFCSRAVPALKELEAKYGNKLKIVFKNQPLGMHPNARPAANAALAANEQGKFWEYHDKLFANQGSLDRSSLEKYAQELNLDMGKFKSALDSNKFDAQVNADMTEGNRVGADGTPTFYVNGRQLVGAMPASAFAQLIDEELKKKK